MLSIENYIAKEKLHHSPNAIVYRGQRSTDEQPVILKLLAQDYPTPTQVARFEREFQLGQKLAVPEVTTIYELLPFEHRWLIVAEDFGGESLQRLNIAGKLPVKPILHIALKITQALAALHAKQVIHKDINPANIIYNPTTGILKLTDLGIATELSREEIGFRSPQALEGTLAYISPEQTGRMNRAIDYRTDFYSLGVVVYELLSGQRPFQATDRLGLIHAHLAQSPPPLPDTPPILAEIVLKLMAKEAESRYQSAWGIIADLQRCLDHEDTLSDLHFELGQHDHSHHLMLTDHLYGRAEQVAQLEALFEQVQTGSNELGVIHGPTGIGKTVLVKELYRAITGKRGYFIEGKYDQFKRDTPYHGLTQAFEGLIEQLLQEDETLYATWRRRVQTAVGSNGQLLMELMPSLELLIGPQPPVPQLEPLETQNRLNNLFREFVGCFLGHGLPLVIFLDDLQWADSGSLVLLEQLVTNPNFKGLLVLATYRDNEVSLTLRHFLEALADKNKIAQTISLAPLSTDTITLWLADLLTQTADEVTALAELLYQKSGGNPFFMRELLKKLYISKQLYPDPQTGQWVWQMSAIQQLGLSDNVVTLLTERLQQLPLETQQVLQYAACIGNRFELGLLTIVLEQSPLQVAERLQAALTAEIVIPLDSQYRYVRAEGSETVGYRFAHDRLQQATYDLLAAEERARVHWRIGQLLQAQLGEEPESDSLLEVVHHLNLGATLMTREAERLALIELNYLAAQRARTNGAFETMAEYTSAALGRAEATDWEHHYHLMLALHLAGAEAACVKGDTSAVKHLVDRGLKHATSILDQAELYLIEIKAYAFQAQNADVVRLGIALLEKLGISLPLKPTPAQVKQRMSETMSLWKERPIAELIDLPTITDPYQKMIITALMTPVPAAIQVNQPLCLLLMCEGIQQGIQYGNSREMSRVYMSYGSLLAAKNIPAAYEFGQLSLQLIHRYQGYQEEPAVLFLYTYFIHHWRHPLQESIPALKKTMQMCFERGNLEFFDYSIASYIELSYLAGDSLASVMADYAQYETQFSTTINQRGFFAKNTTVPMILNLQQEQGDPLLFHGPIIDERIMVPYWKTNLKAEYIKLYIQKVIMAYLLERCPEILPIVSELEQNIHHLDSRAWLGVTVFYQTLVYLAVYPESSPTEQTIYLEKIKAYQAQLRVWAKHSPTTYQHKWYLVEAERLRVTGEPLAAMALYHQAAEEAHSQGFQQEAALANELTGQLYLELGREPIAQAYFYEAFYLYQRWGATAKVNQLVKKYPFLVRTRSKSTTYPVIKNTISTHYTNGHTTTLANLDTETVVKAMQAISQEIELAPLLSQLLQVIVESTGAERGLLLLPQQDDWFLEAEISHNEVTVLQHLPLSEIGGNSQTPKLSASIVNTVIRQAKEVVLEDASNNNNFVGRAYIKQYHPKSILSIPLLNQNTVSGVLYLENNLMTHAFTPERVELVRLFGTQAAISIKNAQAITLKAEQERLQVENDLLEKLNADKDKFFSIVAHDLKGPFLPLLGNLELLADTGETFSPAEVKIMSASSYRSAKRVFNLLESLLDWARIQRGHMEYQPKKLSLYGVARQTVRILSSVAEEKNIALSNEVPSDLQIYADANMVDTVIRNVTNNALKFTESGGQIIITGKTDTTEWIEVSISDNGVGMSEEHRLKLFRIGQNVTATGTANERGTGLGLMMCQEMVQMHGGRIWVESELGQGTTVRFTVPSIAKQTP